jgi:glyoxylase-like metal-dependent hydrolase (beta-lactamase superfamily II)
MIGDEATGAAAVVDPQRDTDQYIAFAADHALQIKHVFLTHLHADFVAGHLELRDRADATIYLGAAAKAAYAFTPLRDGDAVEFGRVRLKALETPGHTPESISIVVYDLDASEIQPHAVLTGDTLFIGDVGRPDLRAALGWSAIELGGMLFDSLHKKLLELPDCRITSAWSIRPSAPRTASRVRRYSPEVCGSRRFVRGPKTRLAKIAQVLWFPVARANHFGGERHWCSRSLSKHSL